MGLEYLEQITPSSEDNGSITVIQASNIGSRRKYQDFQPKETKKIKIVYVEAVGGDSRKAEDNENIEKSRKNAETECSDANSKSNTEENI